MERKGIATERGNLNREIAVTNSQIRQLRARLNKLTDWLKEESKNAPPTLQDVFSEILSNPESKSRWRTTVDLKTAAKILAFLQENHITDISELREKVGEFYGRLGAIRDKSKPIKRRLKTLDEHIKQAGNLKQYGKVNAQYKKLYAEYETAEKGAGLFAKSKAQKALDTANEFHEDNRAALTLYRTADSYLKAHLNGHGKIPLKAWEASARS
ncbi:hypothetical protein FACS1894191_8100 [Clostridia bacterium]|nr:hypothetical protein FACS1894191_8100 [Clostridia bacterium]